MEKAKNETLSSVETLDLSIPCLSLYEISNSRQNWLDDKMEKIVFKAFEKEKDSVIFFHILILIVKFLISNILGFPH
jgi:hypothetical protein